MFVDKARTILLVEDEYLIAMTEKMQLEHYGYGVKTVTSGEEAIKTVENSADIDLILMDINLGDGIDGTEAARIILDDHDLPVVFLSSHCEREVVEKTEKITSYGYVIKNSSITVLDASIKMAFKLFEAKIAARKKEQLIYEHEEKYKLLHEHAGIGIGYYNLDGIILSFNKLAAKHMGGVPEDFIGKSNYDLFSKADADVYLDRIRRAASSDTPDVYEDTVPLPHGNMYFLSTFTRILDSAGNILGVQIISQNITARKQAEEALKESQERLRFALEGSNLGEWDWNLKTNEIKRNERWAQMLDFTSEEINQDLHQAIDLQHPDDRERIWNSVQDHLDGKTDHYSIEYRMRTKTGTYKWIRDCGKIMERDAKGNPLRLCGTHADIDEQKKLDELISKSNTLLYSILDSSPDVIVFALDTNFNYLAFNTKHKEVIKNIWGKDISIGINMLDVMGDHRDKVKAKESFDRALRGESFIVAEEYGDEKLSRQSWLDYYSPINNPDGSIIGFTCFLLNNTKQKNAQDKIEALLAEKELILQEVHHRIKNNMNTISCLLTLQADTVRDNSAVIALQDAGIRIRSMSHLYDKLYRSLEYDEMSLKKYLSSLVDEVIANFPNKEMVKIEKDLQDFVLDIKRLQSLGIMINELITNIMKYAFTGRDRGLITISCVKFGDRVVISIQDDGVGINESVTFENSTGFGLQLVQMLAKQLEGTVDIERGSGTKVVLQFAV